MSHTSRFGVFGVGMVCGVLVLVACSSPEPLSHDGSTESPSTAGPGSENPKPTKPTKPIDSTNPQQGTDGGTTSTNPDQACFAMTGDACGTCCEGRHPAGNTVREDAFDACMCGAAGKCQTECAKSDCSEDDNAPESVKGDACDLCENRNDPDEGTGGCTAPIDTACNANADCVALTKCYEQCP